MSSNENPLRTCLFPRNLCMTTNNCFYCHSYENCYETTIEYLFGIHHCDIHKANAVRDCRAYMHSMQIVKMNDAMKNDSFNSFVNCLESLKGGFPVKRTSGQIQNGWRIYFAKYPEPSFIRYDSALTTWIVPVCTGDDNEGTLIKKCIKFDDFLDYSIMGGVHQDLFYNFDTIVKECIAVFEDGIYKEDYERFTKESALTNDSCAVDDNPDIATGYFNGKKLRILIPEVGRGGGGAEGGREGGGGGRGEIESEPCLA